MRIGIAGFMHESNTFTSEKTELRHFCEAHLDYGAAMIEPWREAHHELGGFIAGCEAEGLELVPLLGAWGVPKGPLTTDAYETIVADLLEAIRKAGALDGLLLALHGAMVCDSVPDADGETLRRVREAIGPDLPLVLTLDMHANISPPMVALPTATIVYRTYPHVDQRERGLEAARLMARCVRGEVRPVQALCKLPMVIHIVQQYTGAGAMQRIMDETARIAAAPGMLSASFAPGYIYADVAKMGACAIAVADGDADRAVAEAQHLARFAFDGREALNAALPAAAGAVAEAIQSEGPVCLMDCGDNIGGGGPGDSTILFAEALRQGAPRICVVLCDPGAAAEAAAAGVGARVALNVGAKTDEKHGSPVAIEGTVRHVSDGTFREPEPRHGGVQFFDQGLTAVIETREGHTVVLNSLRVMPVSLHQLLSLGIDPAAHHILIVKGVTAPLAAYAPIAAKVIAVDTPGVTQAGPESFTYRHRPKPLFPLDPVEGGADFDTYTNARESG